jgi:hypothetical protein
VSRIRAGWNAGALLLFTGLAVVHTWPLASAPGTWSRNDNGDTILHEWIMAWVAHQLPRDPVHLFDANIFYPERHTLAYSDPLIVQSVFGAPLLWAGWSPVLAYNIVLIAGFALTGWTTSLVVERWTGRKLAGILSGTLVAFNAFSLTRLPQIQDLHLEFFPLVLFALDRLLDAPGVKHALQLAGWYVLQALTGQYLLAFTAISAVVSALARPGEWIGSRFKPAARSIALSGLVALLVLTPILLPYWYARAEVGLGRSLEETAMYSAELTDYLATGGRLHEAIWSRRFFQGDALFPGITALALAGAAIVSGVAFKDRRARMAAAIAVVAFALSFGPGLFLYRWLYSVFPLMSGIRGAVRFGQIALVAIGLLAGFGLALLMDRLQSRRAVMLGGALILGANIEAFRAPLGYFEYRGIPAIYDELSRLPSDAVLVWIPFPSSGQWHLNAPFMLVSTRSFHRMLNGYSGFKPPSYYEHARALAGFPDDTSIGYLKQAGVTHVLVDSRNLSRERIERLSEFPILRLTATDGNLRIFQLASP